MGLTIHYRIATDRTEVEEVRSLVNEIRQLALKLPFQEVCDIVEFKDDACKYDDPEDPERWLKIQAGQYVESRNGHAHVLPNHLIAFTAIPGDGSEPANIGLARYPDWVRNHRDGLKTRLRTNLHGWSWSSFCKTQYASNPECGGVANFVRCHLCVIGLLDAIQKRRLANVEVSDEGGYWEHRDARKLAETVGTWNAMLAAVVGQFKDASEWPIEAPITEFANFEHLEAKGRDDLGKRLP